MLEKQVNENLSTPLNIASVRVRGAVRTRESFLGSIIDPILQSRDEKEDPTLGSVLRKTKEIKTLLEESDLFTQVEAIIDRSRSALASPDDVDVVFLTKEKGRYFVQTSTQVGNNEGGAVRVSSRISTRLRRSRMREASQTLPRIPSALSASAHFRASSVL